METEKKRGKEAGSPIARRTLRVMKYLATRDIIEYKPIRQIAKELNMTKPEVEGALRALIAEGMAEKDEHGIGFRESVTGLSFYGIQALRQLCRLLEVIDELQDGYPYPDLLRATARATRAYLRGRLPEAPVPSKGNEEKT